MHRFVLRVSCLAAALAAAPAMAANWATTVVDYAAGSTYPSPDPDDYSFVPPVGGVDAAFAAASSTKLDGLTADTGFGVLTPFNAPFLSSQYVGLGQGGSITLQFAAPVSVSGPTIGVHTASGLIDFDYPNGGAGAAATAYTTPRRATVAVSADNSTYVTLGTFDLNNPSNFYATGIASPGYQATNPSGTPADVEKPFPGTVASFNGQDWSQMLATLNGSAGGTWLDLSGSGLASVSYIRFSVPTGYVLYLDGVVGIPAAAAVPEPASVGVMTLGVACLLARRRRGT